MKLTAVVHGPGNGNQAGRHQRNESDPSFPSTSSAIKQVELPSSVEEQEP